jgi:hypothetical protein
MSVCWLRRPPKSWERWDAIRWRPRNLGAKPASTNPHFSRRLTWKPWSECRQLQKFAFGGRSSVCKNCTLSREPEVTQRLSFCGAASGTALDQIGGLSSVSPVDPDITPIPLVISGLSVQFFTNEGVTPVYTRTRWPHRPAHIAGRYTHFAPVQDRAAFDTSQRRMNRNSVGTAPPEFPETLWFRSRVV